MEFRKQEAIFYLGHRLGSIDGEFSEQEQTDIVEKSDYYRNILDDIDSDLLLECIRNGTMNDNSACHLIKNLDINEKIEIFASLLLIIASDGEASDDETSLFSTYLDLVELDLDPVISRWKEIN